jgi:hypothetical protein
MTKRRYASEQALQKARHAKQALKRRLRDHPDVVAIGIGYRQRGSRIIQRMCVRVHVRRKFALDALPVKRRIPKSIRGVPVDVVQSTLKGQADHTGRFDPLVGGIAVANARLHTTTGRIGTCGAVFRTLTGQHLLLSNWHVLYGASGSDGEEVVQPAPFGSVNVIGQTKAGVISATADCAVAELNTSRAVSTTILGLSGAVLRKGTPRVNMLVRKSGMNGLGRGVIIGTDLDGPVDVDGTVREFVDQVEIVPRDGDTSVDLNCADGDSGSLWIADEDGRIVALHFAGDGSRAVANPIASVVGALIVLGINLSI